MSPVVVVAVDLLVVVITAYGYRLWLLLAQHERHAPGRLVAMTWVWLRVVPLTAVQAGVVVLLALGGLVATYTAVVAAVIGLVATPAFDKGWGAAPLVWTPQLRRLAASMLALHLVVGVVLALLGAVSLLPLLTLPIAEVALLAARSLQARRGSEVAPADRVPDAPRRPDVRRQDGAFTTVDDLADTDLHTGPRASPESAAQALATARSLVDDDGTVWTVTPGLFGLGADQARLNTELGRAATDGERSQLCVVGRTNSRELRAGAVDSPTVAETFARRDDAVAHATANAEPGDVVLLLGGDLPAHYP